MHKRATMDEDAAEDVPPAKFAYTTQSSVPDALTSYTNTLYMARTTHPFMATDISRGEGHPSEKCLAPKFALALHMQEMEPDVLKKWFLDMLTHLAPYELYGSPYFKLLAETAAEHAPLYTNRIVLLVHVFPVVVSLYPPILRLYCAAPPADHIPDRRAMSHTLQRISLFVSTRAEFHTLLATMSHNIAAIHGMHPDDMLSQGLYIAAMCAAQPDLPPLLGSASYMDFSTSYIERVLELSTPAIRAAFRQYVLQTKAGLVWLTNLFTTRPNIIDILFDD